MAAVGGTFFPAGKRHFFRPAPSPGSPSRAIPVRRRTRGNHPSAGNGSGLSGRSRTGVQEGCRSGYRSSSDLTARAIFCSV